MAETKTFRETMRENNAKFKKDMEANKEKNSMKKAELKGDWNDKKAEFKSIKAESQSSKPVGFERTKRTLVNGFALWLAIPAIVIIVIVALLFGVGVWDWFTGLFS